MPRHASWLSVTPEPEQQLPAAVATLVCGGTPTAAAVAAETARVERLILYGRQRDWLRYLHGVVELIERPGPDRDPEVASARALARDVIANHHNLLLGLPGDGAQRTAADRERLDAAAAFADRIDLAHHT
jgi:hypothetical protein